MMMDALEALAKRSLVGKFEFIKHSRAEILEWIRVVWNPFLKYVSRVILLANRWIIFQLLLEEDRWVIKSQFWVVGHGLLVL